MKAGDFILVIFVQTFILGVLSTYKSHDDKYMIPETFYKNDKSHLQQKPDRGLIDKDLIPYEDSIHRPYIVDHDEERNQDSFASNDGAAKSEMENNKEKEASMSWMQNPGILAGIICTCLVIGLLLLLLAVFCIYRIRKRDEGSYALDEPKKMLPPSSEYSKAPTREFYA